ncbi:MAG: hypothetical protein K2X29_14430 [Candidatus Obscuribacterales bacterium]|nr:hypothetical protein [Candidatus Obscuribacterales bacterium]
MPKYLATMKVEAYTSVLQTLKNMPGVTVEESDEFVAILEGDEIVLECEAPEKPNIPGVKFYPSSDVTFGSADNSPKAYE